MRRFIIAALVFMLGLATLANARQSAEPKVAEPKVAEPKVAEQKVAEPKAGANAQAAQRPAPVGRASSRSRTITGRVIDENNQPLEDATIISLPAGLINSRQNATRAAQIRPTSADEQGKFVLENVLPGAYMIYAEAPGYVTAPEIDDGNREQKYYRPGDSVTIRMIKGGVITGSVTASAGEPVVGVRVNPIRVRDIKGRTARQNVFDLQREWKTDDRGVYRIYGLEPGVYLISAGGKGLVPFIIEGYDTDAPTFYPSASRDNATEVTAHSGEEAIGIDIRYRDNKGHMISGSVTGANAVSNVAAVTVVLNDALTEAFGGMAITPMAPGAHSFAFDVVPDGDYVVSAVSSDYTAGSAPQLVTMKGADVTGLELALVPYGSIEGVIALEQAPGAERKPECQNGRKASIEEVVALARLDRKVHKDDKGKQQPPPLKVFDLFPFPVDSGANSKGEFKISRLESSRYHIQPKLPSEDWYVRSITLPPDPPATQPKDAARNGIALKTGERIAGMIIKLSENAAAIRGRVVSATEGERLPPGLRLHMIPAEKEFADDTLRFAETALQSDGAFVISNLPPGRYFLIARAADEAADNREPRPVAWDAEGRKQLRVEGESANIALELQPCQRVTDYTLRYKKK
jgi:protocatechuate 3,4-dioxygenase beta subunit